MSDNQLMTIRAQAYLYVLNTRYCLFSLDFRALPF
jgi:hypothetical protein